MIYDCFTFFNELDLLEIRLNELAGVVDRFVLVESRRTFSNQPKPLYYADNRARYLQFNDRIVHVVVDNVPGGDDPWIREKHQRDCIIRGLGGCTDDDTIIISDADEIPRASVIRPVPNLVWLSLRLSYYFLNYACKTPWTRSTMLPFRELRQLPRIQTVRELAPAAALPNAGWHFSYLGGTEAIQTKLRSFSHQEFNIPQFLDPLHINHAIQHGRDLFDRGRSGEYELVDATTLPAYVRQNLIRFRHLLWSEFREN